MPLLPGQEFVIRSTLGVTRCDQSAVDLKGERALEARDGAVRGGNEGTGALVNIVYLVKST